MRRAAKLLVALAVAAGAVAVLLLVPPERWLPGLLEWIRGAGPLGMAAFAGVYVAGALLMLPGSVFTLGAGFAYGPLAGTLLVSPVSVLASTLAFLTGRFLARDWVGRRIARFPRFAALDQAIAESGFRTVLLLRLSPLFPFNLLNYSLGLTRVRLRDYVLGSALGMLPGTVLYVYLGSLLTSAGELLSGRRPAAGPLGQLLYLGGLLATIAVTVVVSRAARRALDRALAQAGSP
ncbi:MAG: TVP38/TMEM64 family protein [Myxococcaceae bacterium]